MTRIEGSKDTSWFVPDTKPYDRILFSNELVAAGEFNCDDDRGDFVNCGPMRNVHIVFPRTCVRIVSTGKTDFVSTPSRLNIYGQGAAFNRVSVAGQPDHCDYISFRSDKVDQLSAIDLSAAEAFPAPCGSDLYLQQRRLIDALKHSLFSTSIAAEEAMIGFAMSLISNVSDLTSAAYQRFKTAAEEELSRARINKIIEYSQLIETQGWGLVDYARAVEVSPWYLSREFKRHTGMGLHQFIMHQRLRQSLDLLRSRNAAVTTIALDLGFSSHSHFTSAFKAAFSLTPRDFIRGHRLAVID